MKDADKKEIDKLKNGGIWWGKRKGEWWDLAKKWFKEDEKGIVDETDPEYDAQKIYTHYLNRLGVLKK